MKEYICRDELVKAWHEVANWEDYPLIFSVVEKDIPTVTKADICREFVEKLKECAVEVDGYNESSYMIEVDAIDEILEEMEKDEMNKCKGCIHLSVCTSREEKCQYYEAKADIYRDFADKLKDKIVGEWHEQIDDVLEEMEKEQ